MMLRFLPLLFCASLVLSATAPDNLVMPQYQLVPGENDASWQPLLSALRAKQPLRSEFEERRFFPFRKGFSRLQGEIRLHPSHGLSIHYTQPEEHLLVIDSKGGFMADARGRRRELPDSPRARAATTALLHVLQFDLKTLASDFEIYGVRDQSVWRFAFIPKPGPLDKVLHPIIVTGEDEVVQHIEMRKSSSQRIEILIGKTTVGTAFGPEELTRYFR